ncbi:rhomboid-related protein 4 [Daphnia magna]|uniref:rhomboid-related protein 4 n=1 Tax=Daphnia magna TaxID=35525 RepID=UPI001E1BC1F8|nr:rhomboid-related protein 4 [Daphnia magna]
MARQRRGIEMGVLMLMWQFFNTGLETFPPVTLLVIAGQIALYMGFIPVSWDAVTVCLSAQAVLRWREYERLVLSAFEHGDDLHLYYNMLSFLSKGRSLEQHFGSPYFAYLLTVFTVLTSATYVGLEVILSELFDDKQYLKTCAIGFSGVIFALKVLTTSYWDTGYRRYFGFRVSGKYAVWVELVAIQLMVPNTSFVGHLAGILVGIAYTQGPLKLVMDLPIQAVGLFNRPLATPTRSRSNWGSGVSGYGTAAGQPYGWNTTNDINYADYDEAIRRSYETLQTEETSGIINPDSAPLDQDEVRRRRLNRFNIT